MHVEAWLARAAAARPHATAIQTPEQSWDYARLYDAARFAAAQLAAQGVATGESVGIDLPAGLDFAQALHGCLLLGAVAVPIDPRLTGSERAAIIAGCKLIVDAPLGEGRPTHGDGPVAQHDLDATAVVIHTSGTTSAPKPVHLSYGNVLWSALGSAAALGCDPQDRWLCALPLSHVGGLSILLRSAIYATTAVVHERFEVERVLRSLQHEEITLVSLVATTLARLLDAGLSDPLALRCALTGGGPVPAALVERAHRAGVPVGLTYGLSETCSQVTTTPAAEIAVATATGAATAGPPPSAGPPLFCTSVRIADDGEILVQGPTVAAASLADDGWLHTGDIGTLDARGRLRVTGRKADTIISGGENVAPAEVEAVIEAHPQVLEAAVLGRSDPQWGETVIALVLARSGETLDVEDLRTHCAAALAPYKVPKQFLLAGGPLPRTRSGKLLRRELASDL
jgi:O-succinylbenzoic acid--CoA ligase